MDMFEIEGARPLRGTVRAGGSKNACLPLITAALLSEEPTVIQGVPNLRDIREMVGLVRHLGARVEHGEGRIEIDPSSFSTESVPYEIMRKMRASFYAMGPMIARLGRAKVSLPGGCAIGDRPVDLHLRGFHALGVRMGRSAGYVLARHEGLTGTRLSLMGTNGTSVGATCNVLMAAALARGTTIIDDAAREPEVIELCRFLNSMGARIQGEGTNRLRIEGVERLRGTRWQVSPDRIEAATLAIAGLITHGDVVLENMPREYMGATLLALENWGADLEWRGENTLRVRRTRGPKRPLQIVTEPYPGFPTDAQPQLTALLALTPGKSAVRETIYAERFMHVPELKRLGARITTPERGRIEIAGTSALEGAAVMASDLRAGAALILAALAAHGTSQVRRIYHVERGYEKLEEKLASLGAHIRRVPESGDDPGLAETAKALKETEVSATLVDGGPPVTPARTIGTPLA